MGANTLLISSFLGIIILLVILALMDGKKRDVSIPNVSPAFVSSMKNNIGIEHFEESKNVADTVGDMVQDGWSNLKEITRGVLPGKEEEKTKDKKVDLDDYVKEDELKTKVNSKRIEGENTVSQYGYFENVGVTKDADIRGNLYFNSNSALPFINFNDHITGSLFNKKHSSGHFGLGHYYELPNSDSDTGKNGDNTFRMYGAPESTLALSFKTTNEISDNNFQDVVFIKGNGDRYIVNMNADLDVDGTIEANDVKASNEFCIGKTCVNESNFIHIKGDLTGAPGPVGPVGPRGLLGPVGPMGPVGPRGLLGPVGPQGKQGEKGEKGDRGEKGEKGDRGERGPSGPPGVDGKNGVNGIDGKNGINGKDGTPGTNGKDGTPGTNGKDGKNGINGKDGTPGTNGKDGKDGAPGPIGPIGPPGGLVDHPSFVSISGKGNDWLRIHGSPAGGTEFTRPVAVSGAGLRVGDVGPAPAGDIIARNNITGATINATSSITTSSVRATNNVSGKQLCLNGGTTNEVCVDGNEINRLKQSTLTTPAAPAAKVSNDLSVNSVSASTLTATGKITGDTVMATTNVTIGGKNAATQDWVNNSSAPQWRNIQGAPSFLTSVSGDLNVSSVTASGKITLNGKNVATEDWTNAQGFLRSTNNNIAAGANSFTTTGKIEGGSGKITGGLAIGNRNIPSVAGTIDAQNVQINGDNVATQKWVNDSSEPLWGKIRGKPALLKGDNGPPGPPGPPGSPGSAANIPANIVTTTNGRINIGNVGNWPTGWGGGLHAWDVYANGTVAAGTNGNVAAFINKDGIIEGQNITARGTVTGGNLNTTGGVSLGGDMVFTGNNQWILHTPDDRRTLHIAGKNNTEWNWGQEFRFEPSGNFVTSSISARSNINVNGNNVVLSDYEQWTGATQHAAISSTSHWVQDPNTQRWDPLFRVGPLANAPRTGSIHTNVEGDSDASDVWVDYNVPAGMKQGYLVHLPWSNCRYFDIFGRVNGTDRYVFIKRVNSWQAVQNENISERHSGITAVGIAGVNRFDRIRVNGRRGRIHLMGIGWTREEGRDMETGFVSWDNVYSKPPLLKGDNGPPGPPGPPGSAANIPQDLRVNSVGRETGDWFRIFGTKQNGTALHDGLSVNHNGGLYVGDWLKAPNGDIIATGKISGKNMSASQNITIDGQDVATQRWVNERGFIRNVNNGFEIDSDGRTIIRGGGWEKKFRNRHPTQLDGEVIIQNGDNKGITHFNHVNTGENYIRGKTQFDNGNVIVNGNLMARDNITLGGQNVATQNWVNDNSEPRWGKIRDRPTIPTIPANIVTTTNNNITISGSVNAGRTNVARHIDATTGWPDNNPDVSPTSLFLGWHKAGKQPGRVILGNDDNNKRDHASSIQGSSVIATNPLHATAGIETSGIVNINNGANLPRTHFNWDNKGDNYITGNTFFRNGNVVINDSPIVTKAAVEKPICRNLQTNANSQGGGNAIFLDRHDIACSDNEYLTRIRLINLGNNLMRYDYRCCRPNI